MKSKIWAVATLVLGLTAASASQAGSPPVTVRVDTPEFGIRIGQPVFRPAPVIVAPAPVYVPPPRVVYAPPPVIYAPHPYYGPRHHHGHAHHRHGWERNGWNRHGGHRHGHGHGPSGRQITNVHVHTR